MAVNEGTIALAALVIALSAFVIACGQLLQQLFATADGLRRCDESIIGRWSQLVRLRFRWSALRFEVKITTPHFEIAEPSPTRAVMLERKIVEGPLDIRRFFRKSSYYLHKPDVLVALLGTYAARCSMRNSHLQGMSVEAVTWLAFIDDLQDLQSVREDAELSKRHDISEFDQATHAKLSNTALISISRRTRSWDFMPTEIVRPLASTTLGCLIAIVHRMDLEWIVFEPDEGVFRAKGHRRSISGSRVRGLGLIIEFSRNDEFINILSRRMIPTMDSDKMACGILPTLRPRTRVEHWMYRDLPLRDNAKPGKDKLTSAFRRMKLDGNAIEALHASLTHGSSSQALPGFSDLLGIWSEWLPPSAHGPVAVYNPFPMHVVPMGERPESRVVWMFALQNRVDLSDCLKRVLDIYNEWENMESPEFYTGSIDLCGNWMIEERRQMYFKKIMDETTSFLFESPGTKWLYKYLVEAHLAVNAYSLRQAEDNLKTGHGQRRPRIPQSDHKTSSYQGDPISVERAWVYVENVPKVLSRLEQQKICVDHMEDLWWMMALRMQVWNRSIHLVHREGVSVPCHYYDDPTPVYIL